MVAEPVVRSRTSKVQHRIHERMIRMADGDPFGVASPFVPHATKLHARYNQQNEAN